MSRVINFSSGPATLPEEVLRLAATDMLDWRGSGMSVMEMSHRGPEFSEILANTHSLVGPHWFEKMCLHISKPLENR